MYSDREDIEKTCWELLCCEDMAVSHNQVGVKLAKGRTNKVWVGSVGVHLFWRPSKALSTKRGGYYNIDQELYKAIIISSSVYAW